MKGYGKRPCEICGKQIGQGGASKYNHGMAHSRKGEAKPYLDSMGRWRFKKLEPQDGK